MEFLNFYIYKMDEEIRRFLFNPTIGKIIAVLVGIAIIWTINKWLQRSIFSKVKDNSNRYRAKKFGGFISYFLILILITIVYSNKLGNLTVALGVAGAGVAFALQEVIASFAGWLAIMFGGFYKPGDRVELGGITGDVMDIGVLRTTLMETGEWVDGDLYNGRIVLIANSFVFKTPVFNYSGDFPFLWDEIKIPIQFGSNYEKTEEILLKIGNEVAGELKGKSIEKWNDLQQKFRLEDAQKVPMVSIIANDNWVQFTLRYIVDFKLRRATKTLLFKKILKAVDATKGEIKFASATFQLVEPSSLNVTLKKETL